MTDEAAINLCSSYFCKNLTIFLKINKRVIFCNKKSKYKTNRNYLSYTGCLVQEASKIILKISY